MSHKPLSILLLFLTISLPTKAAFKPLSFREKCRKSDIIIHGTVITKTRIIPAEDSGNQLTFKADGLYCGAASIALVKVSHYLRDTNSEFKRVGMPRYIMIPCNYNISESPASLTHARLYPLS